MLPESEQQLVRMIRKAALFSDLKDKHLKEIVNSGKELSYDAGQTIVKEGDDGVGFYLVLDGEVEVRKGHKVLSKLRSGDFFGEMSLLDRQPRSADVVAVLPTTCLGISSWSFSSLVRTDPSIAVNLMKALVERLRGTNRSLTE
jgi:CRP-like cAMP-binding protein